MSLLCLGCGNGLTERYCKACNSKNDIADIPQASFSHHLALKQKTQENDENTKTTPQANNVKEYYTILDILTNDIPCRPVPGFEFLGQLPDCFSMMLFGLPGGGKSTFALRFANSLANCSDRGITLYISEEEAGQSATLKKKIVDNHMTNTPNFLLMDQYRGEVHLKRFTAQHVIKNIIIDSITSIGLTPTEIKRYRDYVIHDLKGILVIICHARKDEKIKYKGDSSVGHLVDIVCLVDNGMVITNKNRLHFSKNSEYKIWED